MRLFAAICSPASSIPNRTASSKVAAPAPAPRQRFPAANLDDLVFTGFNKRVAALHRNTREILWHWSAPSGETYATLLPPSAHFTIYISSGSRHDDPLR